MEFADTVELPTTKEQLWSLISDPETLTECVPGADSIERVSERKYELGITRGVASMSLSLTGEAEFVEMNPPEYIVTTGSAFDGKTGSDFEVLAAMEMTDVEDGVELTYTAEVQYSGGVSTIPKRVLRPIVKRDVDTYFENVSDVVNNHEA
ncbi:carbon monoxide dehydrogenase subunit G [Halorhabdus utahensis DSM 12940]|uniref:Carbon monoxide dehydrogenase subunit G n=1 Tax=Halorhabdus utahensis (strain DSM 12940 / JCM 11049 / AX-2) TaxID=519442 RepID=C7NMU4_HALUD|nr:carbon monoxide dehydrogenase subunit G [Halorhabdus utahensis DSM 12940]